MIRTHQLRRCAAARCPEWTIWRHCDVHLTTQERELRAQLDRAVTGYAVAEEAYVAAVRADAPLAVVEAVRDYRGAEAELRLVELRLGMVR